MAEARVRYRFYGLAPDSVEDMSVCNPANIELTTVVSSDGLDHGVTFTRASSEVTKTKRAPYETAPCITIADVEMVKAFAPIDFKGITVVDMRPLQENRGVTTSDIKFGL